jgi:hypothetical protein
MINMTVADLKRLISDLPDNMPVIIPVWEMRYDNASNSLVHNAGEDEED